MKISLRPINVSPFTKNVITKIHPKYYRYYPVSVHNKEFYFTDSNDCYFHSNTSVITVYFKHTIEGVVRSTPLYKAMYAR